MRSAVALSAGAAIQFAPAAKKAQITNYLWSIGKGGYTLTGGNVPTPEELRAMVITFGGGEDWTIELATNLANIWRTAYPAFHGNAHLALEYMNAFFGGCADAARPTP